MAHIDAGKTTTTEDFCNTLAKVTKVVRFTMVQQQWTGWNKSKKEVLQLHQPPLLVFGES